MSVHLPRVWHRDFFALRMKMGAEPVARHHSISIRFRLFGRAEKQWLTLFGKRQV
jgi:hypothetical protein